MCWSTGFRLVDKLQIYNRSLCYTHETSLDAIIANYGAYHIHVSQQLFKFDERVYKFEKWDPGAITIGV